MTLKKCCRTCKWLNCVGDGWFIYTCGTYNYTIDEEDSFDHDCECYELDTRLFVDYDDIGVE